MLICIMKINLSNFFLIAIFICNASVFNHLIVYTRNVIEDGHVSSIAVSIGMVGGVGDMDGGGGTVGRTVRATADPSAPETGGVASSSLLPFLYERVVFLKL